MINLQRLGAFFSQLYNVIHRILENNWVKYGLRAVIIISCAAYLVINIRSIRANHISVNFFPIALALAGSSLTTLLGSVSWWLTLLIINQPSSLSDVAEVQLKSNLVKYLPGIGWQLLGKAYLTANTGVNLGRSGVGLAIEYLFTFFTGMILCLVLLPGDVFTRLNVIPPDRLVSTGLQILSLLLLVIFPILFSKHITARINHSAYQFKLTGNTYLLTGLMVFLWMINGFCFILVSSAYSPIHPQFFGFFIFSFIASFLIGFLVFVVPASLGIREGILAFMLGPLVGGPVAVLIAVSYRIVVIAGEIISLGLFQAYRSLLYRELSKN